MSAATTPYEYATHIHGYGANVTAVGSGHKKPLHGWKRLQEQPQSAEDIRSLPWDQATRAGTINGINGFRSFDIDGFTDLSVVDALLRALGLPEDYDWVEVSSGGNGLHIWFICKDDISVAAIPAKKDEPGVYVGLSKDGSFDHLELRWARCQTIIASSDGNERWLHGRPDCAPATVSVGDVLNAFYAVASPQGHAPAREMPSHRGADHADDRRQDLEDIRARFDLVAYATMKWPDAIVAEGDEVRVRGHGGLLIKERQGVWYRFTGEQGGDCFDLVGYALYGEQWNRTIRTQFRTALREAATFAGVNLDEYRRTTPHEPIPLRPDRVAPETEENSGIERRLNEVANAARFVRQHGGNIRYCADTARWHVWDGTRWRPDTLGTVMQMAKATAASIYREAADAPEAMREVVAKWARRSHFRAGLAAMVALAQSDPVVAITVDQLDADRWALNCLNGTLNLRTGELRPHDPADLISKRCPVRFDADATLPLWETFIATATGGDTAFADFLRRAAGATLVGENLDEVLFFPHGDGGGGKSTFLEALKGALGEYAKTADFESFIKKRGDAGIRNDIARLVGARLVVSIEVDEGKKLAMALLKTLSGGEDTTARLLYQEATESRPAYSLWLAANHAPAVRADDDAAWRRIIRLPFTNIVPKDERDPQVKATLRNPSIAGAAILAWAMRGCLEWQRDGLNVPDVVEEATAAYRREMNPIADFVDAHCDLSPQAWTATERLWGAYQAWENEEGPAKTLAKKDFTDGMRTLGCTADLRRWQGKVSRGWKGIAFKDDDTPRGEALHSESSSNQALHPEPPSTQGETTSSHDGCNACNGSVSKSKDFPLNRAELPTQALRGVTALQSPIDDGDLTMWTFVSDVHAGRVHDVPEDVRRVAQGIGFAFDSFTTILAEAERLGAFLDAREAAR